MKPSLKVALSCAVMLWAFHAKAQLIGTDAYLKGQFIEVGLGPLGEYGSTSSSSPAGYHPHKPLNSIGFLTDPGMDGWSTGTPPSMGDYFLPGTPFEGWELQIGTERALAFGSWSAAFDTTSGINGCTGANIAHSLSGSIVSSTWQGIIDSVQLTQITYFDTNNLFFNIKIILTNLAVAPKNNIYYIRTLDPDNDVECGGGFATDNKIEHQVKDTTVVSAVGATGPMSYMALGTTDTNSEALIYQFWPIMKSEDLSDIYNHTPHSIGTAFYTQGATTLSQDIAIGLISYIPHLATVDSASDSVYAKTTAVKHPANTATLNYFYAFSPAAVDSAIKYQHSISGGAPPPPPILSVKNAGSNPDVNVYPNPSKEVVNITGLSTTDHISMYNMMGQSIVNNWNITKEGVNAFSITTVSAGSYIILVTDAKGNSKARVPFRKL